MKLAIKAIPIELVLAAPINSKNYVFYWYMLNHNGRLRVHYLTSVTKGFLSTGIWII